VAQIITDRVSVGISACVYNCPVRYNGKAFDALSILGREKADFTFTPLCPECLAGLGVPRMPIHLTGTGQEVLEGSARVLDRRGRDRTEQVVEGARAAMQALARAGVEAFVAKESSPTCGLYKGRALAALPKNVSVEQLDSLRVRMLDALRAPSTRARIRGALWKAYSHSRKSGDLDDVDMHGISLERPDTTAGVMQLVEELTVLERVSFENDLLFGTSPVIRRDGRRVREQGHKA